MKKENALIEGKIDSKLINNFDGEFDILSEKEKELAKKVIKKHRKEEERKKKAKEAKRKAAEKERKRKEKIKKINKSLIEKFIKFSEKEKEILFNAIKRGYYYSTDICRDPVYLSANKIKELNEKELHTCFEQVYDMM